MICAYAKIIQCIMDLRNVDITCTNALKMSSETDELFVLKCPSEFQKKKKIYSTRRYYKDKKLKIM